MIRSWAIEIKASGTHSQRISADVQSMEYVEVLYGSEKIFRGTFEAFINLVNGESKLEDYSDDAIWKEFERRFRFGDV